MKSSFLLSFFMNSLGIVINLPCCYQQTIFHHFSMTHKIVMILIFVYIRPVQTLNALKIALIYIMIIEDMVSTLLKILNQFSQKQAADASCYFLFSFTMTSIFKVFGYVSNGMIFSIS